jgi:hypothetical protein
MAVTDTARPVDHGNPCLPSSKSHRRTGTSIAVRVPLWLTSAALRALVRESIENHVDQDQLDHLRQVEAEEREQLKLFRPAAGREVRVKLAGGLRAAHSHSARAATPRGRQRARTPGVGHPTGRGGGGARGYALRATTGASARRPGNRERSASRTNMMARPRIAPVDAARTSITIGSKDVGVGLAIAGTTTWAAYG